jgi:UDP-N-acetylmuramyl pentapeptide phosphotransferase/UDP-N-acetylglucosamine-1-phosphate transferase
MSTTFLFALITFAISVFCVDAIRRILQQYLMDIPNERSSHSRPTPRSGGVGFILAFAVVMLITQIWFPLSAEPRLYGVWLALTPLIVIGIVDDWRNLPAAVRYLVQLSVATAIVLQCGPFPLPFLEHIGLPGSILATGLTIVGMTALINFYNFMDGLDGLVAGVSATQLGVLALWFGQPWLWLLVAALAGFLVWNWSPAKIFMGDAGSTFLGAITATALLSGSHPDFSAWATLALTLPLIGDAIYTLARRLLRGENIFQAHRSHLYQRLQQAGWSHARVASAYIGVTGLVAIAVSCLGNPGAWLSLAAVLVTIGLGEAYLQRQNSLRLQQAWQLETKHY